MSRFIRHYVTIIHGLQGLQGEPGEPGTVIKVKLTEEQVLENREWKEEFMKGKLNISSFFLFTIYILIPISTQIN